MVYQEYNVNKLGCQPIGRPILLCCAAGLVLRLLLLIGSGWRMDYDEAVNGLLALGILRGEWVAFIPPEVVGGTGTPYLMAGLFALLGASPVTFRLPGLLFAGLYIITTGLLARRAFGPRVGITAALLAAFAPPYLLFVGLKSWNVAETLLLGNLLLLLADWLLSGEIAPRRGLFLLGLVAGVMFWLTWLGFYYYLPVGALLLWRGRALLWRGWWAGLTGFALGSLPFWAFNLAHGFPTFTRILNDTPMTAEQIGRVLTAYVVDLFPRMVTQGPGWGTPLLPALAVGLYAAGLAVLIWQARQARPLPLMLALLVLAVPLIFAFSTHSRNSLPEWNPWGVDATGRYVLLLHTVLPVGVALLRRPLVALVIMANLVHLAGVDVQRGFDSPYYNRLPRDLAPLVALLDEEQITHIWADNGIGHVLMFVTQERILAADYYDTYIAGGLLRFPDVLAAVEAAPRVALVVPILPGQLNPPLQQALDTAGVDYRLEHPLAELAVFIPAAPFDLARVAAGLGYQYG